MSPNAKKLAGIPDSWSVTYFLETSRHYSPKNLLGGLHNDASFIRIALQQGRGKFLRLLKFDMRRQ